MSARFRMTQLRITIVVFALAGAAIGSIQPSTPPGRLRIAILGFANETGAPEEAHWRCGIERLLSGELEEIKAIRLGGGVEYAHRPIGVEKGDALTPARAQKMGELIEAQRVVWGGYEKQNKRWRVRAYVMNVASGKTSGELVATAPDWFELRDALTKQILRELFIEPSEAERQRMGRRWTKSPKAFEWYSQALAFQEDDAPLFAQGDCIRKAIADDPQFAKAHLALAATLGMKGEFTQAEQAARQGLRLSPDSADAHRVIGVVSLHLKKFDEAEQHLHEAHRLDPDNTRVLIRLAELSANQKKWDEAIELTEKARFLEPTNAPVHALLGFMYSLKRDRDQAIAELKEAERLEPEGLDVIQRVGQAYERLREIPLAIKHFEKFITRARELGADPGVIRIFEQKEQRLKASLIPTFIEASMPKIYTEQSLQHALRGRLTDEELAMVVNPIASSEAMKHWAEQLTQNATSDLDKAKALFDALAGRIQPGGGRGTRTAKEVFAAWNASDVSFCCQEFAKLFVATARDVNLMTFYVHLEKDYKDKVVSHDCAIVFIEDKALLVDPAYCWFGVPHKDIVILDDLQTIAHHFFQHGDNDQLASRCRLADKLHPNFAWGQVRLASALYKAKKWNEARKALDAALHLEPNRWDAYLWKGIIAGEQDDNLNAAADNVLKALELNPESALVHFTLANIFIKQGKLEEARDEFRVCLRYEPEYEMAEVAHRTIAQINERIGIE